MATVVNRATKELRTSVNTPDFNPIDWIINPDLSGVAGVPSKYWNIVGDIVSEMSQGEKDAVNAAEAAALTASNRAGAIATTTESDDLGIQLRELVELFNKRDNYLANRIIELQDALDAVKASSGPADNIRAAIPVSWLATTTRTRADAIQDYTDDINAGGADS